LLGDKICPQHVELFDVLHYTKRSLYLFHVKEGFGQKTRDACSQIWTAAQLLHTRRHKSASKIVAEFYREASSYKGKELYRLQVQTKIKQLGEKGFGELFNKNIVFVYAFVDTSAKAEPRLLKRDKELVTKVTPESIAKVNQQFKKKGKEIFDALVKDDYLTKRGYLTSKFFAASAETFTLPILKVDNQRKSLYRHLSTFCSQFDSTIAKLELLRLEQDLQRLGFQLRICQIDRTDYPKDIETAPVAEPHKDYASLEKLPELYVEDIPISKTELGEGQEFTHEEETFLICRTEGDGACGLHALLGTKKKDKYIYNAPNPNEAVRQLFAKALEDRYEGFQDAYTEALVALLKDYLDKKPSIFVKRVFGSLKAEIDGLRGEIEKLRQKERQLKDTQETQFTEALDSDNEELERCLGTSINILRTESNRRNGAFRNNLDDVLNALEGTDEGEALTQTQTDLRQLEVEREALYTTLVQKPEVLRAYLAACQDEGYYFSDKELCLAAHLFHKRVKIYAHRYLDEVFDPMVGGPEEGEEVVIFHKRIHYSRCENSES
jgi:hypothetical protein